MHTRAANGTVRGAPKSEPSLLYCWSRFKGWVNRTFSQAGQVDPWVTLLCSHSTEEWHSDSRSHATVCICDISSSQQIRIKGSRWASSWCSWCGGADCPVTWSRDVKQPVWVRRVVQLPTRKCVQGLCVGRRQQGTYKWPLIIAPLVCSSGQAPGPAGRHNVRITGAAGGVEESVWGRPVASGEGGLTHRIAKST